MFTRWPNCGVCCYRTLLFDSSLKRRSAQVIVERQNSDASQEPLIVPTIKIERCQSNSHNGSENTRISEYELPLDILWELPRSKLIMGESLGEGAFGKVVKAEVQGINRPDLTTTVAVKMLKGESWQRIKFQRINERNLLLIVYTCFP